MNSFQEKITNSFTVNHAIQTLKDLQKEAQRLSQSQQRLEAQHAYNVVVLLMAAIEKAEKAADYISNVPDHK